MIIHGTVLTAWMARAGDIIDQKYRLTHPLGIGGMGAVWRAEHLALRQHVAIKLLDARGPAAERSVARFQREAQIAASIRHRNIVYISDFGTDKGMPYLVMELLNGVALSERLVVGEPLSVATFLGLMDEILQALSAVHKAGVVHRDMKPENIFLVRDDASVLPKLLDFGVSRSTDRGQGHTITREGIVMGTPEYIAPEQARGKRADVRSDLYSMGVVIYEALAGRLPFQADNSADLIVAVLNAAPIPLSSLRPELGPSLSALVHKAMARKPEERFQSAEEMRSALVDHLHTVRDGQQWALPRRYVAPLTTPSLGRTHATQTPTEAPATRVSSVSGAAFPGSTRSWRGLTAVSLGAVAAATALIVVAMAGGAKPVPAARARAGGEGPAPAAPFGPAALDPPTEPRAAPPGRVRVELFGVPSDGTVYVDGTAIDGARAELVRSSGLHDIEVRAPGRQFWHVLHDASADGRYALALESLPAPTTIPIAPTKRASKTEARVAPRRGTLLRTPDF